MLALALATGVGCSPSESEYWDAEPQSRTAPLDVVCNDIGGGQPPVDSEVVIHDAAALPSIDAAALAVASPEENPQTDHTTARDAWYWAKQGLRVRPDHHITISAAGDNSADLVIGWGNESFEPSSSVVVDCESDADWLTFPGGYWVREPGVLRRRCHRR